jgi:6-phosphogluconolactonase
LPELSFSVADFIAEQAETNIKKEGVFSLVLSGGTTPRPLYEYLAQPPFINRIDWQKTHLFWGDERCLPTNHADSNFALVYRALISKIDIPPKNIHRIPTEMEYPQKTAEKYEEELRNFFRLTSQTEFDSSVPSFDLVLLGLGADGHTASLFPGDESLEERERWVVAVDGKSGSPAVPRITLTFAVINQSRCVVFLASGEDKREVFRRLVSCPQTASYPAARVKPSGKLLWFIDESLV